MRSPEAARALPELVRDGVLAADVATPLLAAARGDVVSIRAELRALLGLAVALVTSGIGLLLEESLDALGPGVIALLIGAAAAGVLALTARRAPAFSWRRSPDPDWIVDGLVLLTVGLVGAELAWIETQFAALGESWPWHLLVVSLVTGTLAVRFDSVAAWTVALTTFAAWRGVSLAPGADLERTVEGSGLELRLNLLACALVFALVGQAAQRLDRKAHFEPASTFLAALAAGLAFVTGLGEGSWQLWALALAGLGVVVARWAFGRRRLGLFALGALAIYVGVTRFLFALPFAGALGCFWFAATSIGAIVLLVVVQRRFRAAGDA
jgi:hypothetical protein